MLEARGFVQVWMLPSGNQWIDLNDLNRTSFSAKSPVQYGTMKYLTCTLYTTTDIIDIVFF